MLKSKYVLLMSLVAVNGIAQAEVSFEQSQVITRAMLIEYAPDMKTANAVLHVNEVPQGTSPDFFWNVPTVRAGYGSYYDGDIRHHYLTVYGGYGKLPFMTVDTLAATFCHELGHGIGGEPFKNNGERWTSSTEGQSDYFAYRFCLKRIFKHFAGEAKTLKPLSAYTDQLCKGVYSQKEDLEFCTRAFHSLEVERAYLRHHSNTETNFEIPDKSVVSETDLHPEFYPSPQCRLDTMIAGVLAKPRPACWYKSK